MKNSLPLTVFLAALLYSFPDVFAQTLRPQDHPNHYILLIDASGSAMASKAPKGQIYRSLLEETLLTHVYETGFGEVVPPMDSAHDVLTLLDFGIVTGSAHNAYSRLRDYDLLKDFIHPVTIRQQNLSRRALLEIIKPSDTYRYTILSWAKQLALATLQPSQGFVANRTFFIFVHDGDIIDEQARTFERTVDEAQVERVHRILGKIQDEYLFSDGFNNDSPAWRLPKAEQHSRYPFYIEAYEILSRHGIAWEEEGLGLDPVQSLRFSWIHESSTSPSGNLEGELHPDFLRWLEVATVLDSRLYVDDRSGGSASGKIGSSFQIPLQGTGRLGCDPRNLYVDLEFIVQDTDRHLGARTLRYSYTPQTLVAPKPIICTLAFWLKKSVQLLLMFILICLAVYFVRYSIFHTQIEVRLPGFAEGIHLHRLKNRTKQVSFRPREDLEILQVLLPSRWVQNIFYRNLVLTLVAPNGSVACWQYGSQEKPKLALPVASRRVSARWIELPSRGAELKLILSHRYRTSQLRLVYLSNY